MPLSRFALFALLCATACRSTTLAASAPVVRGATYDLVALDGRPAPFEFEVPGRAQMVRAVSARVQLTFEDEVSYAFVYYTAPDAPALYRSSYRQRDNGTVQLMGYGTFPDGVNREFVEGGGIPQGAALRLQTMASFIYGAHVWTFQHR